MLHDGNRIFGHQESDNTIREIFSILVKDTIDGEEDSPFIRFAKLIQRMEDQQISHEATWNSYLRALEDKNSTGD